MNLFTNMSKPLLVLVLSNTLLIAGCSDSGSPQSTDENETRNPDMVSDGNSDAVNNSTVTNAPVDANETESTMDVQLTSDPATGPTSTNPETANPAILTKTRVKFNITVPLYFSDALQVKLVWGETELVSQWVESQLWTTSGDFPLNTENNLSVTFYEHNGDTTLASYETQFKTGTNDSETYEITADQFDSSRWDTDEDGFSNMDELIAGTDPTVDEGATLEVRTYTPFDGIRTLSGLDVIEQVSQFYENRITGPLPFSQNIQESEQTISEDKYRTTDIAFDIDVDGNGSIFDEHEYLLAHYYRETKVATRTNTDGVIKWAGTYYRFSSDAYNGQDIVFSTESAVIDTQTRRLSGVIDSNSQGYGKQLDGPINIKYDVTGLVSTNANNSSCKPIAGTIVYEHEHFNDRTATTADITYTDAITRITKVVDDEYWRVRSVNLNGRLIEEYLISSFGADFFGPYCNASSVTTTANASDYPADSVAAILANRVDVTIAFAQLKAAGLDEELDNYWTLFLPTNEALAANLDFDIQKHLYKDASLSSGTLSSYKGKLLTMNDGRGLTIDGGGSDPLTIADSTVVAANITGNIVRTTVHVIDSVIGEYTGDPYPGYTAGSLADIVFQSAAQSALHRLRQDGRLDLTLNDASSNWTVFLPNRTAFQDAASYAAFQSNAHFYSNASLSSTDLIGLSGTTITMNNGVENVISGGGSEPLTINGIAIIELDLRSASGDGPIVHVIDGMLDTP